MKLSEKDLIKRLGEPERRVGNEWQWKCPYCKDSHKDNLKFNLERKILWCFADKTHAPKVLKEMFKGKDLNTQAKTQDINYNIPESRLKKFVDYSLIRNEELLDSASYLEGLKNIRGLSKETIKMVKLGLDSERKLWVLPNFQYSTKDERKIFSFEYRLGKFSDKKIKREPNTPTGLVMINSYTSETEALVMVEGLMDGYVLLQYLNEKQQSAYYHIVTPSNGVATALQQASEIEFYKYKKFYLYLDNDEAGNKATTEILQQYPMFEVMKTNCQCKDFNEHYLKCIKKVS